MATPAGAFVLNGNEPWPGDPAVIEFSSVVKGSGDKWAVKTAVQAWNDSGLDLKFKRVPKSKAALVIHYFKGSCNQGFSSISFPPFGGETNIGACNKSQRYQQVQLVAHELGHVIGLGHENGTCAVMNERNVFKGSSETAHPFKCSSPPRGSWRCRILQKDDLKGALRLYGGKLEPLGPANCKLKKR